MLYHVEFVRQPTVLEADDRSATDADVVKSLSPGDAIETALSRMNLIVWAGVVGDGTFRGVTLC